MTKKSYKIHVIAMIRNEADILPGFITRSAALFDMIHVAEHQSTDGSRQILEHLRADFPSLHLYDYRFRAFYQDEVSNCMARQALECGADWVFLLDADEFLDVEDRAGLEALNPTSVLARGYSLTFAADGKTLVRDPKTLKPGDLLITRVADGELTSRVEEIR